jgi:nucleotide-binding universal stress UspA family protein
MGTFRNILVYTSGDAADDAALVQAASVAHRTGGRLRLIDVLSELPHELFRLFGSMRAEDVRELAAQNRREALERMAEPLRSKGLEVTTTVRWGRPFLEVVRAVVADDHDLVVAATDSLRPGLDYTTHRTVRVCPVPVWAARAPLSATSPKILAAVDATLHQRRRNVFDTRVLAEAKALAELLEGELHVVHAWHVVDAAGLRLPSTVPVERVHEYGRGSRDRHAKWLTELMADVGVSLPPDHVHLVEGAADVAVTRTVYDIGAELLVMGTVRTAGEGGFFVGQVAEGILERLVVSLFAVKPDGFVTPVQIPPHEGTLAVGE